MKKLKVRSPIFIRGTHHLTKAGYETEELRQLIQRRRLQVLVHSCLYYKLATSVVSDHQWQQWADELVILQKLHPQICKSVDYHKDFEGFDGSTGFQLPFGNEEILTKAYQLQKFQEVKKIDGRFKSAGNRVVRVKL